MRTACCSEYFLAEHIKEAASEIFFSSFLDLCKILFQFLEAIDLSKNTHFKSYIFLKKSSNKLILQIQNEFFQLDVFGKTELLKNVLIFVLAFVIFKDVFSNPEVHSEPSLKNLSFFRSNTSEVIKRCPENIQELYRKTPMPKCDFNKVALEIYWNRISAWVFSSKFAAPLLYLFLRTPLDGCFRFFLKAVNYFRKKFHGKCLTGFWIRLRNL